MPDGLRDIATPVYFPFTHLTQTAAGCLKACFPGCVVYSLSDRQPVRREHASPNTDGLDIRIQGQVDGKTLEQVFNAYQSWAALHPEGIGAYLKTQGGESPHFDDQSVSRIAEAIRCEGIPSLGDEEDAGVLLKAGLFLYIAERYDAHVEEKDNSLRRLAEMEEDFIAGLREADDVLFRRPDSGDATTWEDTGSYMTEQRIVSWVRLMAHDPLSNAIFVTTSPAVLSYLREMTHGMELVMEATFVSPAHPGDAASELPPNPRGRFETALKQVVEDPRGLGCQSLEIPNPALEREYGLRGVSFTLYRASDLKPWDYLGKMAGSLVPPSGTQPDGRKGAGTLIGLVRPV